MTIALPNHASGVFVDISHDNLYKTIFDDSESIQPMKYEHEIFCAYRFPGKIKHTTCLFEYSRKFLRYGLLKFHNFGGRGYCKAYCEGWNWYEKYVQVGYLVSNKLPYQVGLGNGPRKKLHYNTCITGNVIHRHSLNMHPKEHQIFLVRTIQYFSS